MQELQLPVGDIEWARPPECNPVKGNLGQSFYQVQKNTPGEQDDFISLFEITLS